MKKFLILFLSLFFLFSFPVHAQTERIEDFTTEIQINKNGTIDISERITYDFVSLANKHGIFRNIPYRYKNTDDGKFYEMKFDLINVVDEKGQKYKHKLTNDRSTGWISLKIGDPNQTVTGKKIYVINYKVAGALRYLEDHDELYWNTTGNDWTVPITNASSEVKYYPSDFKPEEINLKCFTGPTSSTATDCTATIEESTVKFTSTKILASGEGLTIAFAFPKGLVDVLKPTPYILFSDRWYGKLIISLVVILGFLLAGFWYLLYPIRIILKWFRYGRDPALSKFNPESAGQVQAWYDPPKTRSGRSLTPAETGALVDETVHQRDISAIVVDMARRGYLHIKEKKKNDFYFTKKKEADVKLMSFEKKIFDELFQEFDEVRIKGLELYKTIEDAKGDIYNQLVADGFFPENPEAIRTKYLLVGIAALVTLNPQLAAIAWTFGRAMPRKTDAGVEAANIAKSLRNFLSSQERQLKFLVGEADLPAGRQVMFEKLLPYAVAFGVEKIWADRFRDLHLKPPEWYSGYDGSARFSSTSFTRSLNSSFTSFARASTPPSSSSSGFSGGSSGGGGGGGGGGSW